jgi:hypothetical protein
MQLQHVTVSVCDISTPTSLASLANALALLTLACRERQPEHRTHHVQKLHTLTLVDCGTTNFDGLGAAPMPALHVFPQVED